MQEDLAKTMEALKAWIERASTTATMKQVNAVRLESIGKNGEITLAFKKLKLDEVPAEDRRAWGAELNVLKETVTAVLDGNAKAIAEAELEKNLRENKVDVTLPPRPEGEGRLHPISQTLD